MMLHKRQEPRAASAEIHEDVSRDAIADAFRKAMIGHLRSHMPGTNINEHTLLASDYLNQFRELVMLLDALAADPANFAADLHRWQPLDYEEHFARSELRDKDLAVAAYRRAPENVRDRFDSAVARLQSEALRLVASVGNALDKKSDLKLVCDGAASRLRILIDNANAIANGYVTDEMGRNGNASNRITIDTLFRLRKA